MSKYLTVACLSLAMLASGTCLGAASQDKPAAAAAPTIGEETMAASRAFVRLWHMIGAFDEIKHATVIGKTLYLAGAPRGLEAVDTDTGNPRWLFRGRLPLDRIPVEAEGALYLVEGGRVTVLDPASGEERSSARTRSGILTPLYPAERYCVYGSGDEYVYGVEPATGVRMWRHALPSYPVGSAWDGKTMVYFQTADGTLTTVSLATLPPAMSWAHKFTNKNCSPPAVAGNTIYLGSADFYLYALDGSTGDILWKKSVSGEALEAPVVIGKRVYAATADGLIHALDADTHEELWTVPGKRVLTATTDHVIFQGMKRGANSIGMADAATGAVIAEATAERYVAFAGAPDGIVFAVTAQGEVLAVGDRAAAEARAAEKEKEREKAAAEERSKGATQPATETPKEAPQPTPPATPAPKEAPVTPAPAAPAEKP